MTEVQPTPARAPIVDPKTGVLTLAGRDFLERLLGRTGGAGDQTILKVRGGTISVDKSVIRFDGSTSESFQGSNVVIDDSDNMTVPGTVNNRDVGADGTKLDGIEASAEVNDIVVFETVVDQADLASGGTKVVLDAVTGEQWKVREIFLSGAGTNFSGGDRLLDIGQGSIIYSTIPAATLQALAASRWGDTGVPFPATASDLTTETALGTDIVAQYSGGTGDYTAGSCTIVIIAERVAP